MEIFWLKSVSDGETVRLKGNDGELLFFFLVVMVEKI
jgi:hypothetical protein